MVWSWACAKVLQQAKVAIAVDERLNFVFMF
jgi:hypothetical protein